MRDGAHVAVPIFDQDYDGNCEQFGIIDIFESLGGGIDGHLDYEASVPSFHNDTNRPERGNPDS